MCTLTWKRDPVAGLEVFFNRDELKSRPVAEPPACFQANEVSFLSPRDPKGGGTWMVANEYGIVICLLNKWELERSSSEVRQSRGQLVWAMAGVRKLPEVDPFLDDLTNYPAFTLAAFCEREERFWEWDGKALTESALQMPVTSSSYSFEAVKSARVASYRGGLRGADFHASGHEEPSAFSVRMCRPDAQTWSRSRVRVANEITWEYFAEQADLNGAPVQTLLKLPRR